MRKKSPSLLSGGQDALPLQGGASISLPVRLSCRRLPALQGVEASVARRCCAHGEPWAAGAVQVSSTFGHTVFSIFLPFEQPTAESGQQELR